eukprot:SAG11_NODE_5187_length_1636_cov_1.497723_1_plen_109_part_00
MLAFEHVHSPSAVAQTLVAAAPTKQASHGLGHHCRARLRGFTLPNAPRACIRPYLGLTSYLAWRHHGVLAPQRYTLNSEKHACTQNRIRTFQFFCNSLKGLTPRLVFS